MGDVRIPAVATLLAAVIAVGGSIFAVWRSGQQQLRLQEREFTNRAAARDAQWAEEQRRASLAAEVDVCVHFDAAVAGALAHLRRMVDFVGRPGVRRKLLGRDWARQWHREVTAAAIELAVPISRVRMTARPVVCEAVDAVATAFTAAATAVSSLPGWVPEPFLVGPVTARWRERVEAAIAEVQSARDDLAAALEGADDRAPR